MIRKFKCIACGKKFDADDKDTIVCPKCHSDNVKPVKPDYLKPIGLALVLLVSVGAGMFVTKQCKSIELESGVVTPEIEIDTIGDTTKIKHDIDPELLKTIEIQNTLPVYDKKTKAYSLNVTAKNIPAGAKVIYELCQEYDPMNHIKKVLMTSDDGNFENVPASKNECSTYYVVLTALGSDGQVLSTRDHEIGGFEEVKPVSERITKAQLQSMINRRDIALQGGNHTISNNVVILVRGDSSKPDTFQDVFNNLEFGIWRSVSVMSVDYDSEGRINKVVLSAVPADNE